MDHNALIYYLNNFDDFQDFFVKVTSLSVSAQNIDELKVLKKVMDVFKVKFKPDAITCLKDAIDLEMVLFHRNEPRKFNEKAMQMQIVKNFNLFFPKYTFVECEKVIEGVGRIDIYALCDDRDVIIELKVGSKSPNAQLIAYGSKFNNPILIGITEKKIPLQNRIAGIIYFTFEDLKRSVREWLNNE